jgi:hypothetical protein
MRSVLFIAITTLALCACQPVRQLDDLGRPSAFEKRLKAEREAFEVLQLEDDGRHLPLPH